MFSDNYFVCSYKEYGNYCISIINLNISNCYKEDTSVVYATVEHSESV